MTVELDTQGTNPGQKTTGQKTTGQKTTRTKDHPDKTPPSWFFYGEILSHLTVYSFIPERVKNDKNDVVCLCCCSSPNRSSFCKISSKFTDLQKVYLFTHTLTIVYNSALCL